MDSLLIIFQVLIRLRDNSKLIPEFGQFAAAVVKLLDGRELKDIVTLIAHTVPNLPFFVQKIQFPKFDFLQAKVLIWHEDSNYLICDFLVKIEFLDKS